MFVHSFAHRAMVRCLPYVGQCSRPQLERVPAHHRYPPQGYLWFHRVKASPEGCTQSWRSPGVWEAVGDASRRRDPQSEQWLPPCPTPCTQHDESQQQWEEWGPPQTPPSGPHFLLALGSCQCHWGTAWAIGQVCHQEASSGRWEWHCLACLGGTGAITIYGAGQGQGGEEEEGEGAWGAA